MKPISPYCNRHKEPVFSKSHVGNGGYNCSIVFFFLFLFGVLSLVRMSGGGKIAAEELKSWSSTLNEFFLPFLLSYLAVISSVCGLRFDVNFDFR